MGSGSILSCASVAGHSRALAKRHSWAVLPAEARPCRASAALPPPLSTLPSPAPHTNGACSQPPFRFLAISSATVRAAPRSVSTKGWPAKRPSPALQTPFNSVGK